MGGIRKGEPISDWEEGGTRGKTNQEKHMRQDWDSSGEGKGRLRLGWMRETAGLAAEEEKSLRREAKVLALLLSGCDRRTSSLGFRRRWLGAKEGNKELGEAERAEEKLSGWKTTICKPCKL